MSMNDTRNPKLIQQLIFGYKDVEKELKDHDQETKTLRFDERGCKKPSAYVETLEVMINAVSENECHLLTPAEWRVIEHFKTFSYNTRYCLARLLQRKPNCWHAQSSFKDAYVEEIGEEGFKCSMEDICTPLHSSVKAEEQNVSVKMEEEDCIDLTAGSDDDPPSSSMSYHKFETPAPASSSSSHGYIAGSSSHGLSYDKIDADTKEILNSSNEDLVVDQFCENETSMSLEEVLHRLDVPRLKELIKVTKTKPVNNTKDSMITALLGHGKTQSTLNFTPCGKGKGKARDDGFRQTTLSFFNLPTSTSKPRKPNVKSAEDRLREQALEKLGKCVRLNYNFYRLIRRMHIIWFRSTEHPKSILLPALLTTFKKRTYASYAHSRSGGIWNTREDLLRYEQALQLEAKIDEYMELIDELAKDGGSTKKASRLTAFRTPVTPTRVKAKRLTTPLTTPNTAPSKRHVQTPGSIKAEPAEFEELPVDEPEVTPTKTPKEQKADVLKYIYEHYLRDQWETCIGVKRELTERSPALERFEPGYVYTRLICRAADSYATLKEYSQEYEIVQALLGQRFWRRGKRAIWYTRRAVLQTRYLHKDSEGKMDQAVLRRALEGIYEALQDNDTGIVWRPGLVRRIQRLEKSLKIPKEQCVVVEGVLRNAKVVELSAARVDVHGMKFDNLGRPIPEPAVPANPSVRAYFSPVPRRKSEEGVKEEPKPEKKRTGKSYWEGRDGGIVTVEECSLEYYINLGYRGFHSETSIITTIFGLLFWDIIFARIPGAFVTEYQAAPLDIGEDTFYAARKGLIDERLEKIRKGNAVEILKKHDEMYREKATLCVGVKWDLCSGEDLVEIVECIGGMPLAHICQLLCEDYMGRSSGVPDLIVWNAERKECKFVEVKGPGDTPMENQKLWFDSLLRGGANVEICRVIDTNCPKTAAKVIGKRKRKTPVPSSSKRRKVRLDISADVESDADYDQLDLEEDEMPQVHLERAQTTLRTI